MSITKLSLTVASLTSEPVLVAAWKKAHDYIRQHNWYADVRSLDMTNANLEHVLQQISDEIRSTGELHPDPLRLVLAPKSQTWKIDEESIWKPSDESEVEKKLRPLAHASIRDQIIAMAFAILFADAVETRLGDPRSDSSGQPPTKTVSYGNRLMCDGENGLLRFRWGSTTSYRKYFQDYQEFVRRPRSVVKREFQDTSNWAIIHADLSKFYDRVRPNLLHKKITSLLEKECEAGLIDRFRSFFNWGWDPRDVDRAESYALMANPPIKGFDTIALPQGLVASGFFANAILIDFDDAVTSSLGSQPSGGGWQLTDYCRYVDDMRIVVRLDERTPRKSKEQISDSVLLHVEQLLHENAERLEVNKGKAQVILGSESAVGERPVAAMMERIAQNTSGVMDLFLSEEVLNTLDTLLPASLEIPLKLGAKHQNTFPEVTPDVQDATVARFSAHRFRTTYRRSRPAAEARNENERAPEGGISRQYLDQKAAHFSRRLIERWISDPSNVRLLRVALDLRPDPKVLELVIDLLTPYITAQANLNTGATIVAIYCASELLRAGATETGNVPDPDQLPADLRDAELKEYRKILSKFARICYIREDPWYLRQQALLFMSASGERLDEIDEALSHPGAATGTSNMPAPDGPQSQPSDVAPLALLQRHHKSAKSAVSTLLERVRNIPTEAQASVIQQVLKEDQDLGTDIWSELSKTERRAWREMFKVNGIAGHPKFSGKRPKKWSLVSLGSSPANPFQQEYAALHLAKKLLDKLSESTHNISAAEVFVASDDWSKLDSANFPIPENAFNVEICPAENLDTRFVLPGWVREEHKLGYKLGQLLRVVLTGRPDFTSPATRPKKHGGIQVYRPYKSAWLIRRYGLLNGRNAFGPDWIPISSWFGSLLSRLLEWPGFSRQDMEIILPDQFNTVGVKKLICSRVECLEKLYGRGSKTPLLPIRLPRNFARNLEASSNDEPFYRLRVGVVQTAFPSQSDFTTDDPQLNDGKTRRKHRRHLSSVLGGVRRMLQVRGTHHKGGQSIELLILPELSVHPDDVRSILIPFARQHSCAICAGVVFYKPYAGSGLVNTAHWILPVRSQTRGLTFDHIAQGKHHLTDEEKGLRIKPFRPAQWVFEFSDPIDVQRFWSMTGSICYDATDLRLASDLRDVTDMYVVPALNRDVGTFDNMVAALHYHMFQHVIVANSGGYGGSTAQAPFENRNDRTIFHAHGNGHVTLSFFDLDLGTYKRVGRSDGSKHTGRFKSKLKTPPAGFSRGL